MSCKNLANLYRNIRGVSAIEMAILLPLILLLVTGIIEFGLYFLEMQIVQRTVSTTASAIQRNATDPSIQATAQASGEFLVNYNPPDNYICAKAYDTQPNATSGSCTSGDWSTGTPVGVTAGTPYYVVIKAHFKKVTFTPIGAYLSDINSSIVVQAGATSSASVNCGGPRGSQVPITSYGTSYYYPCATPANPTNVSGSHNNFIGAEAGYLNTSGSQNNFIGIGAGRANTTGSWNNFIGVSAGYANTSGQWNDFLGYGAGMANTTGSNNLFLGYNAGQSNTTADGNTFVGAATGGNNTTGHNNSFFGAGAGVANTTGSYNTGLGNNAGNSYSIGDFNTFVGFGSGIAYGSPTLSYSTAIGANAVVDASHTIVLGTNAETVKMPGVVKIPSLGSSGSVGILAGGQLINTSDERLKDIKGNFERGIEDLKKIIPINYIWKAEANMKNPIVRSGFSAQNVRTAIPEAIGVNPEGYYTLEDRPILAAVVNAIKKIGEFIEKIENGNLTIGKAGKPTAITVYDKKSQAGCLTIDDVNSGSIKLTAGACPTNK